MLLSKNILANTFGDTDRFCGAEHVIHAILYHHLINSGLSSTQVAREQPVSSTRIDLVIFNDEIQGRFYNTDCLPQAAIEIKGGAYGDRNALSDEICFGFKEHWGYCNDMEKLEKEAKKGIESWFICVDMPELGRAVDPSSISSIESQCRKRGVSFAYFCQGEDFFFYSPVGASGHEVKIEKSDRPSCNTQVNNIINVNSPLFNDTCRQLLRIKGSEANTVAAIYQLLRVSGFSASQLSLETYFCFAKSGKGMHDRPDMTLFDGNFDGMFNLYRKGNREWPNDAKKMAHIDTIFEIKGSASMEAIGDKARLQLFLKDILKIKRWQLLARENGCKKLLKAYFICLDARKRPLPDMAIQEMAGYAEDCSIVYISNGGTQIFGA